jgi:hypothetical protein
LKNVLACTGRSDPPHPRVFLRKSVEEIGKNRVAFLVRAKKRKRVCKSVKTKGRKNVVRDPCTVIRGKRSAGANGGSILRWSDCKSEFHFGNNVVGETPTPLFFVSVASKGVGFFVNPLNATLAAWFVSVAFKWVRKGRFCGDLGVSGRTRTRGKERK